jgi:endonuclease I
MKSLVFVILFLCSFFSYSQVVINEIDPNTASTDVKEFVELKSTTSNFSLDGYIVVFFNAGSTSPYSGIASYYAIDLDGLVTDGNGIVLLGNPQVTPAVSYIIPVNTIQNGPDVVAIYLGNASDFPLATPAIATNLIDAIAYTGNITQPSELMRILGISSCTNENINGLTDSQSIQRKSDGTYEVKTPTPRANNDGSGIIYNGIAVTSATNIIEGQNYTITFTIDNPVVNTLNFNITLNNGSFNSSDYSGSLIISIPAGSNSASTIIQILNDGNNEGDENMKITIGLVPSDFVILNNNITVRVHDINFDLLPWGSPINPSHGLCPRAIPAGYYNSLEGKSGLVLKQAIQDIIANPNIVRVHNYGDVYTVLKEADQNPENNGQVWMIYDEQPISKIDYQTDNSIVGKWNREHIYCQSRLGLPDTFIPISIPDGINNWRLTTGNDDIEASHSDNHHLRAVGGQENSSRNNRNYGIDYNGPTGSLGSWNGDVARAIFYMTLRYNGLAVENGDPDSTPSGHIGDLATLLAWNATDTADDFEMNRNNVIYEWQKNRNPFIDYPTLVDYVFGSLTNSTWFAPLSNENFSDIKVSVYPNPSTNQITISGLNQESTIEIFSLSGIKLMSASFSGTTQLNLNLASGMYLAKILSDNKITTKKLIIK